MLQQGNFNWMVNGSKGFFPRKVSLNVYQYNQRVVEFLLDVNVL